MYHTFHEKERGFFRKTVLFIGELEDEGLVVRKRGRGTFVADPSTNRRGVRYSFTTEVSSMGKEPSSTLVDFQIITPPAIICEKMELREGTPVYCFTRVRVPRPRLRTTSPSSSSSPMA